MSEIICYTSYLPEGTGQYITFFDLLLNDNLANGRFDCPEDVYEKIGNINTRLGAKQNYEFLLRAAREYPLKVVGMDTDESIVNSPDFNISDKNSVQTINAENDASSERILWEEFRTDCYVAGKYSKELIDNDLFNPVVETLLNTAKLLSNPTAATALLEKMLSHSPEYYEIDDNTRPILIYRGDDTCYNQLNTFADELSNALTTCHQRVEVFDVRKEGISSITKYRGQHFKAIVGIQTYLFSIKMQDKITNLHDLIVGPKFNMILDHPVLLKEHIMSGPKDYYLLIHDRNYLKFAKQHFKNVKDCFFFSPAGVVGTSVSDISDFDVLSDTYKKKYAISFIGTYYNYRNILSNIRKFDKKMRFIANRFLIELRYDVNQPAETALKKVLKHYQMNVSDNEFLDILFELRYVFFGVMYYYREKVIRTLLDAGIEINVYGSSWDLAPFASELCLKRHPQITGEESLTVMAQSLISLNIMAWHKDGFTERIANSMLNKSVVVSDKSTQLEELFVNNKDLVMFDLNHLDALPDMINTLLNSSGQLSAISQQGYLKAVQNHLWKNRANQLLEILDTL